MSATVSLKDIVEAFESQFDDQFSSYVDMDTGKVITLPVEILSMAEEEEPGDEIPEDIPGWQIDDYEIARRIVASDQFKQLPSQYELHEWQIMHDFAASLENPSPREALLKAIRGSGAFRYFKHTLRRFRLEQRWYAFRDEALREIAKDWCREHNIAWRP